MRNGRLEQLKLIKEVITAEIHFAEIRFEKEIRTLDELSHYQVLKLKEIPEYQKVINAIRKYSDAISNKIEEKRKY